jgi:hypothetical protein
VAGRGVLFAIDDEAAQRLQEASGDDDAVMEVIEEIEEAWDNANLAETDKAWDAIHRALTDGALEWNNGTYPLNHVILGGRDLMQGDHYVAVLKTPDQVRDVAAVVAGIDRTSMADRYSTNVPTDYAPMYGDEDRAYTADWFDRTRMLYLSAAESGRWVLFTVDQ